MPAQAPALVDPLAQRDLVDLGLRLRERRKALRLPAANVARAANMSRQTLNRIEHGEPSVTIGAYINALRALGLELAVSGGAQPKAQLEGAQLVRLADYPQLKMVAWHRRGETITEQDALGIYERNWRHIDLATMAPDERAFIGRLVTRHGRGALLV